MRKLGSYRLLERVGAGGMGEVFLALQEGPGGFARKVALKVLLPELADDPELVHRFVDEGRIAATLSHPHVCQVLELGEEAGQHYIAMEFLDGQSLSRVRRRASKLGIPLAPEWVAYVMARAAEGLAHAHEKRGENGELLAFIHRDVSPENIFVTYDGQVKVVDFGLARAAQRLSKTKTGRMSGKIGYMAREQLLGAEVDARVDVYGLGVTLYELLSGQALYGGRAELEIFQGITQGTLPVFDWELLPADLVSVVRAATHPSLERRLGSARELQRQLDEVLHARQARGGAELVTPTMGQLFADERARAAARAPLGSEPISSAPARTVPLRPKGHRPRRWPVPLAWFVGSALLVAAVGAAVLRHEKSAEPRAQVSPAVASSTTASPPPPAPLAAPVPPPVLEVAGSVAQVPHPAPHRRAPTSKARPTPAPVAVLTPAATTQGKLTLDSSPWAEVFLGERKLGTTPIFELSLATGHHTLRLVNPTTHLDRTVEVDIAEGKTTAQRFTW